MQKLLIFPYNGNGLEALDCLGGEYDFLGFIDDSIEKQEKGGSGGYRVFSRTIIHAYPKAKILAVPGSPQTYLNRKNIIDGLELPAYRFATVIHPKACVSPLAKLGSNVLIMGGVVITSSNAVIGNHVCILPNTTIHHEVEVDDYCLIGSNIVIAGFSKIHKNCYIGSGSNIKNNIEVGENCLVGMGTNVIKSLPANVKAVGNPAKIIGAVK